MKKIISVVLALIMCGAFIVGTSAMCYEGAGDIEIETGLDLVGVGYEDTGYSYWYEWEIAEEEDVGYGEIEFTIYYDAFDWQGEQYCEGPEDYPSMLEYFRESYGEDYTVTDCYVDGYPAIIVEYTGYSETTDSSAEIYICGGKYFYIVNLYVEDMMIYDGLLDSVKGMELNGETGEPLTYNTSADEENDQYADDEVYADSDNTSGSSSMSPVVRNIIIIAVVVVVAVVCGAAVCVIVIVAVKGKKK